MKIAVQIGIHNTGYFSSACLCVDGKIAFASPEERLSRIKYDNDFPHRSITEGLRLQGLTIDDVDEIVLSWNPAINAAGRYRAGFSRWVPHPMQRLYSNLNQILPKIKQSDIQGSETVVSYSDNKKLKFTFVNHHLAHIGLSLYSSPFENAAVLSADGYGEKTSTVFAHYTKAQGLTILKEIEYPHSLGMFYAAFTEFLGFAPEKDEWKLMGASAYGDPGLYYDKISKLIRVYDNGEFELDLNYFEFYNFDTAHYYSKKLVQLLGEPNTKAVPGEREYHIAAAVQKIFEESVIKLLRWLYRQTKSPHLCFGGGTALNSVLNGTLTARTPFTQAFIPFAPDDSGNAIGALMYLNRKRYPFLSPYLGGPFGNHDVQRTLHKYHISALFMENDELFEYVSAKLCEQKIVGWFQGRMEFGQRALGNRSILADPRRKEMKDIINKAVKYREAFRPFAPSIIASEGKQYFENYSFTPYMEKVLRFKRAERKNAPAVVHEDGTGRLQSVRREDNPRYYALLREFESKTKVPILLNTSFNKAGEPIVYSIDDALKTFFTSGLDMLVLENYILEK